MCRLCTIDIKIRRITNRSCLIAGGTREIPGMLSRDTLNVQHEIALSHLRGRYSRVLNDTFSVQVPANLNR